MNNADKQQYNCKRCKYYKYIRTGFTKRCERIEGKYKILQNISPCEFYVETQGEGEADTATPKWLSTAIFREYPIKDGCIIIKYDLKEEKMRELRRRLNEL